jgi:SAM-dependent methyltransferase
VVNQELLNLCNKDYTYPIPPRDTGARLLRRRLAQLLQALRSRTFASEEGIFDAIKTRYATDAEIEFYKDYIHKGLQHDEIMMLDRAIPELPQDARRALVVGGGTGREAFALERIGFTVDSIDNNEAMVREAMLIVNERRSTVRTWHQDFVLMPQLDTKYDLIILTGGLNGHLPGRMHRVQLLKNAAAALKNGGQILFTPEIWKLKPFTGFWMASQILRLRWRRTNLWRAGDTVRSFFGNHNATDRVVYYHYYVSAQEVGEELAEAGLLGETLPHVETWRCWKR